jgi:hypothetical protein
MVPERGAVLAVVQQRHIAGASLFQGIADLHDRFRVGLRSLKKAAVFAMDLAGRVAAHALEGGIMVDQRVIGKPGVADHDTGLRCMDDPVQQPERLIQIAAAIARSCRV